MTSPLTRLLAPQLAAASRALGRDASMSSSLPIPVWSLQPESSASRQISCQLARAQGSVSSPWGLAWPWREARQEASHPALTLPASSQWRRGSLEISVLQPNEDQNGGRDEDATSHSLKDMVKGWGSGYDIMVKNMVSGARLPASVPSPY